MDIASYIPKITEMAIEYAPKVALALVTLIIGFWIIGKIVNTLSKAMARSGMDISLNKFLGSFASALMKVMLFFSVAGMVGINTTGFIALIGALMVGVGMALNGSIGHFASGVMIMLFKSGQGQVGVELTFGIGYGDDIDKARQVILDVGKSCPHVLSDPAQGVVVAELGDSSVNLATRPFCKSENYWDTFFYMQENVKKEFDKQGIGIPYPTMDVNMISSN